MTVNHFDLNLIAPCSRMSASSKCQYCLRSKTNVYKFQLVHLKERGNVTLQHSPAAGRLSPRTGEASPRQGGAVSLDLEKILSAFLLFWQELTSHHLPPLLLLRLVQNTSQVLAEGSACAQLGAPALHHLLGGCLDQQVEVQVIRISRSPASSSVGS